MAQENRGAGTFDRGPKITTKYHQRSFANFPLKITQNALWQGARCFQWRSSTLVPTLQGTLMPGNFVRPWKIEKIWKGLQCSCQVFAIFSVKLTYPSVSFFVRVAIHLCILFKCFLSFSFCSLLCSPPYLFTNFLCNSVFLIWLTMCLNFGCSAKDTK